MKRIATSITTKNKRSSVALSSAAKKSRPKVLSFSDLEIPVEPLLSRDQEYRSGTKIRSSLKRLSWLLTEHPMGFRRFLARMQEFTSGGLLMFPWLQLRDTMPDDLRAASRSLDRALTHATRSRSTAVKALAHGAEVLRRYTLDPETLYQWSREVISGGLVPQDPLSKLDRSKKVHRCLQKCIAALERERDRLVLPNFRLVLKEVFRYHPTGMKRSDLFQEGILGLHKAVFRFDAGRSIRFSTYATYWIRQSIRKCLIDKSRLIRVPQAIQEELRKPNSTLRPAEADRVRKIMGETILFSYGESDDSNDRFSFDVRDPSTPELGETLHMGTIPQAVCEALRDLNSRERDVVQRRFGLGGARPQTLEEIGVQLNLSRERIRQIEQEALSRMRKSGDLWDVYEDLGAAETTAATTHN